MGKPVEKLDAQSLEWARVCAEGSLWNPATYRACGLFALWDPADDIAKIHVELTYDPDVFEILPGESGFLCDFSSDGSCPTPSPNAFTFVPDLDPGAPRAGTTFSLTVLGNTVILDYDMTANPANGTGDRDFFALAVRPKFFINSFRFYDTPGSGDFQFTSVTCRAPDETKCGTNSPAWGSTAYGVPEPATWSLMILGFGLAGGMLRARGRRATVD